MSTMEDYRKYLLNDKPLSCDLERDNLIWSSYTYMLLRLSKLFKWNGLPDTINPNFMEFHIMTRGHVGVVKVNDKLYALPGGLCGEPDVNYIPQDYIMTNVYLNYSETKKRDVDCVVIPNDFLYLGLYQLNMKHAILDTDATISIDVALINKRIFSTISAKDDATYESAKSFVKDVKDGKISIIREKEVNYMSSGNNNLSVAYNTTGGTPLQDFIESKQYIMASWYNDLGLNAMFNMKRESLNNQEIAVNENVLKPLIEQMLEVRKKACEKINSIFNQNWSVEFDSTWKYNDTKGVEDDEQIETK